MRHIGMHAAGLLAIAMLLSTPCAASIAPDPAFRANFESPPDCASVGSTGCPGFLIGAAPVSVDAGLGISYCYYFQTPNAGTTAVSRWSATFERTVTHNIVVYATYDTTSHLPAARQPPGTLSTTGCGFGNSNNTYARRLYSSHSPEETLRMPQDDGTGSPLAIELPANSPGFVEIYFLNPTGQTITSTLTLYANTLADGSAYTPTATYMTYNGSLSIASMSSNVIAQLTCPVPAAVKFWWLSTHTHKHATNAALLDGATTLVSTSDWEAPAIAVHDASPFYTFTNGLTYSCTFNNSTNSTINAGDNYATDENCVGIGYFFPATGPLICYNAIGPL